MRALTILLVTAMIFDHRFEGSTASISIFEIIALVGAGAILLSVVAWLYRTGRIPSKFGGGIPGVMWGYLLMAAVSAFVATVVLNSTDGLYALRDMVAGLVLAALVIMRGGAAFDDVYWAVAVVVALAGALALMQTAFGWPYLIPLHEHAYFKHAVGGIQLVQHPAVGPVAHPNAFAVLIGPLVVMSTGHAVSWKGTGNARVLLWSLLGISLAGLIATQAKMAVMVFTFGAIATAWLVLRRSRYSTKTGRLSVTVAVIAFAAILIAIIAFGRDLPSLLSPSTLIERAFLNGIAIDALTQSAMQLGFGGCVQAVLTLTPTGLGVHNEYISQCIKFGVPTAVLFCACMYSALNLTASTGWRLAPALIATCVVFLVEGAAGVQHQAMVFLLWACAVVNRKPPVREPEA